MQTGMLSSWITDLEGSAVESDPAERETVSSEPPISPSLDNCRRFCVSTHDHRGTLLALLGLLHTARYSHLVQHCEVVSQFEIKRFAIYEQGKLICFTTYGCKH